MKIWLKILIIIGFVLFLFAIGRAQVNAATARQEVIRANTEPDVEVTYSTELPAGSYILGEDGQLYPVNIGRRNVKNYCKTRCGTKLFGKEARCRRACKDTYM